MFKKNLYAIIIPILILISRPFSIDFNQSIVLASLVFTITTWVIGHINRTYMSLFLLAIFMVFGNTSIDKIFSFPLSENFFLILFSFLFSQGISNTNLGEKLLQPLLYKYTKSLNALIISMVLFPLLLIFIIPQPFSRIIILSLIYYQYFNTIELEDNVKRVLMFGIFLFSFLVNTLFVRGDIVLNLGLMSISGIVLSETEWIKYMTLPGTMMVVSGAILFLIAFRKDLKDYSQSSNIPKSESLTRLDWKNISIILFTTIMWATESLHSISSTLIVILGCILFFFANTLEKKDLNSLNIGLMIFLTAAFSIGAVINGSGIAEKIFSSFTTLFLDTFSIKYVFIIITTTMGLHMILGSNVTTLSVVIPSLLIISSGIVKGEILIFIIFLSIVTHSILPFHNVVLIIGEGKGYFTSQIVMRFGLYLTVLTIGSIFLYFIPYWRFMGLL